MDQLVNLFHRVKCLDKVNLNQYVLSVCLSVCCMHAVIFFRLYGTSVTELFYSASLNKMMFRVIRGQQAMVIINLNIK